jgi:hypothetical protein
VTVQLAAPQEGLSSVSKYHGIVHHGYAPEGQTINKEYYLEAIRHLRDAVRHKRHLNSSIPG